MAEDKSRIEQIVQMENLALTVFTDKWETAKENARFFGLKQWTVDETNTLKKQNRLPYQFDKTSHALNILLGTQREGRLDIQYLERTADDAARTQVLNNVWKYYADTNEFIYRESDVFQDGIVNQCGIFGLEIDKTKHHAGDLRVFRIPFDQCLWDTNGRQYDLSDAAWFSYRGLYRRDELKVRYPEKQELIDVAGKDAGMEPKARPLRYDLWYDKRKELIGTREVYERGYKTKYLIWQVGSEEPEELPYETKESAESEIANRLALHERLTAEAMSLSLPVVPAPQFEVLDFDFAVVTKTCAMLNGVLEKTEFPMGDFPFSVYFAYFNDGDFWTALERMKDPQRFFNRMMIQADYWVGTMAKGLVAIDSRTSAAEEKAIREAWGKTGGIVKSKYKIEQIESKGPAFQLFQLMDRAESSMDDTFGGGNMLGLKQTASESGRAVLARQAQAGLDNFVPLDNLRRTKLDLGKKIAWFLTNKITSARKIRITGNTFEIQQMQKQGLLEPHPYKPTIGYMEVNNRPENTIENLEVDVVVSEAEYSPNKMMANLAAMTDAFKSGMVAVPPPPDVAIDMLPIPQELKERWKATLQPKEEPVSKGVSINYKDIPPDSKMQVLEKLGIPAQPQTVAMKEVMDKPHLTQREAASGQGA